MGKTNCSFLGNNFLSVESGNLVVFLPNSPGKDVRAEQVSEDNKEEGHLVSRVAGAVVEATIDVLVFDRNGTIEEL